MLPTASRSLALTSLLLVVAVGVTGATRPRYGGDLRIEMSGPVRSLSPAEWPDDPREAAAKAKLVPLIFDCLVSLDDTGRPRPGLAVRWTAARQGREWTFELAKNVRFHDGTALTPRLVAGVLTRTGTWTATASARGVTLSLDAALPGLLEELAHPRHAIYRTGEDGSLQGTGPFRIAEWDPGSSLLLEAHDECWRGRPFLDSLDIELGQPPDQRLLDFELGQADLVELPEGETPAELRTWSSPPLVLLALVADESVDPAHRSALARSVDRAVLHEVLFRGLGEPASSLLPNWITGYAFLFDPPTATVPDLSAPARPLPLLCDSPEPLDRAAAERIALDATAAGLPVRVQTEPSSVTSGFRLRRIRLRPLSPSLTLDALAAGLYLPVPQSAGNAAAVFRAEAELIATQRVIPILFLPEVYAVRRGLHVHARPAIAPDGSLHLADIWLEDEEGQ